MNPADILAILDMFPDAEIVPLADGGLMVRRPRANSFYVDREGNVKAKWAAPAMSVRRGTATC